MIAKAEETAVGGGCAAEAKSPLSLAKLVEVLNRDCENIGPERMAEILQRVHIAPGEMKPYVCFSDLRYARNLVHKTDRFEIMIMCWQSGQRSSIHDHAGSLGGLKVISGELTESLFVKAANGMIKAMSSLDYRAGAIRIEQTSLIHQISNLQPDPSRSISLHVYVPPLVRMNVYSLEDPAVRNILPRYFNLGSGI